MSKEEGFIKIFRDIRQSAIWFKPNDWFKIWQYILLEATWEDNALEPVGSFMTSYDELADKCRVSKNVVKNFLEWARSEKMVKTEQFIRGLRISAINYHEYQIISYNKTVAQPTTPDTTPDTTLAPTASNTPPEDSATHDTTPDTTPRKAQPIPIQEVKNKRNNTDTDTSAFLQKAKTLGFSERFGEVLSLFIKHRKEKRAKITPTHFDSLLKKFEIHGEVVSILAMEKTIEKGWQGLFFNDSDNGKSGTGRVSSEGSFDEEV